MGVCIRTAILGIGLAGTTGIAGATSGTGSVEERLAALEEDVRQLQAEVSFVLERLGAAEGRDARPEHKWNDLKVGRSMDEVRKLLGEPLRTSVSSYHIRWQAGKSAASGSKPQSQDVTMAEVKWHYDPNARQDPHGANVVFSVQSKHVVRWKRPTSE